MPWKPIPRKALVVLINRTALLTIEQDDQKFGRQLATILEKAAASLRVKFGGHSLLLTPRLSATKMAQSSSANGAARTLEACKLAYGHPDPTPEGIAAALGLKVTPTLRSIVERVHRLREAARRSPYASQYDVITTSDNKDHRFDLFPPGMAPEKAGEDSFPRS